MKPCAISGDVLLPGAKNMVGECSRQICYSIEVSLYNNTVCRRIDGKCADILDQEIQEGIKSALLPIFSVQFEEFTEVATIIVTLSEVY